MPRMTDERKGVPLHTKILIALVLGAAIGVAVNLSMPPPVRNAAGETEPTWLDHLITYVMRPIGEIFLRLLFLTVIPLVFSSLSVGVAQLGAMGNLGRIGVK